jgi:hypothetical protein
VFQAQVFPDLPAAATWRALGHVVLQSRISSGQALGSGYASVTESLKPFSAVLKVLLGLALLTGVCWVGLLLLRARNRAE